MTEIWQIWVSGGGVMIPLFALAVLIYTQAFQLVMEVRHSDPGRATEPQWSRWVGAPEEARGRVAEIIKYTQADASSSQHIRRRFEEVHLSLVAMIDRRTRFLSTLVAAAPLLGLLGTVLGMLRTFVGISTSGGTETAGVVAAGISEALVTTQTGLTIALPGLFIVMLIQRQRHALESRLAHLESLTLSHLRLD